MENNIKDKKVLNVPNLRFPEFCGEWTKSTLSSVATVTGGGTPPTEKPSYWNGNIQWFTPTEVGRNKYISTSIRTISQEGLRNSSAKLLPANAVLLSSRATVGECSINDIECATNQGFQSMIAKENIYFEFLYYLALTKKKIFIKYACGSTFLEISNTEVKKIKCNVPLKDEQTKIAKLLSLVDERIETQNKIIDKLESLIKGMNDYFYLLYRNSKRVSLSQLGNTFCGLTGKSAGDFGSGKPFITYLNVNVNRIVDEKMVDYVQINETEHQNKLQYGDALFTISSETPEEVGISAIFLSNEERYLNSFCMGYRLNNFDDIEPKYMPYLFSNSSFRKFVFPFAQGSTRYNLCKNGFLRSIFCILDKNRQIDIANILDCLSNKNSIEKICLLKYREQKQYLLANLFI